MKLIVDWAVADSIAFINMNFVLLQAATKQQDYELSRFSLDINWSLIDLIIINCLYDL